MLRITELLGQSPTGLPLVRCLPTIPPSRPNRPLHLRAALASALVAGLELAREGVLDIHQREPFGSISVAASLA